MILCGSAGSFPAEQKRSYRLGAMRKRPGPRTPTPASPGQAVRGLSTQKGPEDMSSANRAWFKWWLPTVLTLLVAAGLLVGEMVVGL